MRNRNCGRCGRTRGSNKKFCSMACYQNHTAEGVAAAAAIQEEELSGIDQGATESGRVLLATAEDILTAQELQILELRFGTDQTAPRSLEDVCQILGIPRSEIRHIEMHAMRRLKERADNADVLTQPEVI